MVACLTAGGGNFSNGVTLARFLCCEVTVFPFVINTDLGILREYTGVLIILKILPQHWWILSLPVFTGLFA